jgi:uncharacterized membrane protein YphA (DoxX/SURF4 family)
VVDSRHVVHRLAHADQRTSRTYAQRERFLGIRCEALASRVDESHGVVFGIEQAYPRTIRSRWIIVTVVAVVAVAIGALFGYIAALAVVFVVATVGLFWLFFHWGGSYREAEQIGRGIGAERFGRDATSHPKERR